MTFVFDGPFYLRCEPVSEQPTAQVRRLPVRETRAQVAAAKVRRQRRARR
ncbi:hypothetical protein [Methylibium rhizosphaerae]|nr:hypothetical protein [Methylibium rhizosphaerae]